MLQTNYLLLWILLYIYIHICTITGKRIVATDGSFLQEEVIMDCGYGKQEKNNISSRISV